LDSPRHGAQHLELALGEQRHPRGRRRAGGQPGGEGVQQPAGHPRGDHRVAPGDGPDRAQQLCRLGVLEQEGAGPGPQRREGVLVEVEGGEPVPAVGRSRPTTTRIVVDLPAPLGPRKPVTRPGWMVTVRSSTAVRSP
jgi:hypothetical protein